MDDMQYLGGVIIGLEVVMFILAVISIGHYQFGFTARDWVFTISTTS